MSERLAVGIVGLGHFGRLRMGLVDSHPDLRTAAVCDRAIGSIGLLPNGAARYERLEDMLAPGTGAALDALLVCLPPDVAPAATIAGLEAGLHVFCEKPPARTVAELERVRAVEARRPGRRLMYGFDHRHHASVRRAVEIVRSGELGRLLNLRGVYGKNGVGLTQGSWRGRREVAGGGILLDQGIHLVDLFRLFGGEFPEVHSFVDDRTLGLAVEDNAYALLRSEGGAVGLLHSSATEWQHRFRLELGLERGALELVGILSPSESYSPETLTVRRRDDEAGGARVVEQSSYGDSTAWREELGHLVRAVREAAPPASGSSLEALRTLELVERIYDADAARGARLQPAALEGVGA